MTWTRILTLRLDEEVGDRHSRVESKITSALLESCRDGPDIILGEIYRKMMREMDKAIAKDREVDAD